jgi:hypothetical protein
VLHVSLLGEQTISDDQAGSIRGRSSRVVVLVAFLAMHAGSAQSRQRIACLLWPGSTPTQALTNPRRELHHLRGDRRIPGAARHRVQLQPLEEVSYRTLTELQADLGDRAAPSVPTTTTRRCSAPSAHAGIRWAPV